MGCCCPCCWVANSSFVTLWTVAYQPLSMHGISPTRILEWVAFPSPGYLPDPGIEPVSPALASGFFTHWATGKPSLTWGMHTELEIISISKLSISILYYENIASLWLLCHSTWTVLNISRHYNEDNNQNASVYYFLNVSFPPWTLGSKIWFGGLPGGLSGKESTCLFRIEHGVDPWSGKIPHPAKQLSPCTTIKLVFWSLGAASTEPPSPRAEAPIQVKLVHGN